MRALVALLVICCGSSGAGLLPTATAMTTVPTKAAAQESYAQKRSEEILTSFNKRKHEVREVFGVRNERYKEIRSEPVVRRGLGDYAGTYEVPGLGYLIRISAGRDGEVGVTGYEPRAGGAQDGARRFRLEGLRLDGALLSGTKVYEDGAREKLEGVFINMTDVEGASPTQIEHRATTFGLGVTGMQVEKDGVTSDKIFYHLKQQ